MHTQPHMDLELAEEYKNKDLIPVPDEEEVPGDEENQAPQRRRRVRLTTETLGPSLTTRLKQERKTIYYSILAVIIFTILAIYLRLNWADYVNRDKQHAMARETKLEAHLTRLDLKELKQAKEKAKKAEKMAEKALQKQAELAKEVEALKELLKQHGMEPQLKKEPSLLQKLSNLFQPNPENEAEKENEVVYEQDLQKSLEKAFERIHDLEDETELLKSHARLVEGELKRVDSEFDKISSSMHELDETLSTDFATVDADLHLVDTALLANLDRHVEERNKLNEIINHLRLLSEYVDYHEEQVERIDGLEDNIEAVAETTQRHEDRLDQHDQRLQEHSNQITELYGAVQGNTSQISQLRHALREKEESLRRAIASQSARHDSLKEHVMLLNGDLIKLHNAVTADLKRLDSRLRKVTKMAEKPMKALSEYKRALESVKDSVNVMHRDMSVINDTITNHRTTPTEPEPEHHTNPKESREEEEQRHQDIIEMYLKEWSKKSDALERRILSLEAFRRVAIENMEEEYHEKQAHRKLKKMMRRDNYDIEAGQQRVKKIMEEVEELRKPIRMAEAEALRERVLAPATKIMADLEEKYKDAPVIGALFSFQR